ICFPPAVPRGRKNGQRTGRPVGGSRGRICCISRTELPIMFNPVEVLIDAFGAQLRAGYRRMYGGLKPDSEDIIFCASSMSLENIANSDAIYHNAEHTILVTLVGQEILRGKHMREGGITPEDWLLYIISLLCHDIGFVRGVCRQDQRSLNQFATGKDGQLAQLPDGCSDASLNPYHVDRGKLFVHERFHQHKLIDPDVICRNIELTRFPVPADEHHKDMS